MDNSQNINSDFSQPTVKSNSDSNRFRALFKASMIAVSADIILVTLKASLAALTGSAVLTADAWHSTGDFAVSFTVLLSIILNYKYKEKPWARNAEGLVALLISVVLIFGSIKLITSVFSNEVAKFFLKPGIPLVVAIFGISLALIIAFEMYSYKRRVGEKHKSIAFIAESQHTLSDYFSSFGVLITLIIAYFGLHIERITTFLVGLLVLRIGFKLLFKSLKFFNIGIDKSKFNLLKLLPEKNASVIEDYFRKIRNGVKAVRKVFKAVFMFREDWISKNRKAVFTVLIALTFILYIGTGFHSIQPYQTGITLAFGGVAALTGPGAHYHLPQPFGSVIRVDTEVIARVESGYRTVWDFEGEEPSAYLWEFAHRQGRYMKVPDEAITITGDENLIDVNALCYYRINDPVTYAFGNVNSHETLRNYFIRSVHETLGRYRLDDVLSSERANIQREIAGELTAEITEVPLGVEIVKVLLLEIHPPLEVVPQYRAVASARERKDEIIHQAGAYMHQLLPRSRGNAKAKILEADAFAKENIFKAQGKSQSFLAKQSQFRRFSTIQGDRLRWETFERTLKGKQLILIPEDAKRRVFFGKGKSGVLLDE